MKCFQAVAPLLLIVLTSCSTTRHASYPVRWAVIDTDLLNQQAKLFYEANDSIPQEYDPSQNAQLKARLDQIAELEGAKNHISSKYRHMHMSAPWTRPDTPPEPTAEEKTQLAELDARQAAVKAPIADYYAYFDRRAQIVSKVVRQSIISVSKGRFDTVFSTRVLPFFQNHYIVYAEQIVFPPNITEDVLTDLKTHWGEYQRP